MEVRKRVPPRVDQAAGGRRAGLYLLQISVLSQAVLLMAHQRHAGAGESGKAEAQPPAWAAGVLRGAVEQLARGLQ